MRTTIKKDHVLLKNSSGEYHLSLEKFKALGKKEAIKFAEAEINKKKTSVYSKKTITFKDAKNLGFCEYGIEDFCKKLNLDITKEYELDFLCSNLTVDVINNYKEECLKLFGKKIFKAFGGALGYLENDGAEIEVVFKSGVFSDHTLYLIACDFAYLVLHLFEEKYPDDKRPRLAIEARLDWLEGKITDGELETAAQAAAAACGLSSTIHTASAAAAAYYASSDTAAAYYASSDTAVVYYAYYAVSAAASAAYSRVAAQKEYVRFMLIIELGQK